MDEPICRAGIETQGTDVWTRGWGGMNWEIRIDVHVLPCVKQIASGNLLYSTGSSVQCSVMTEVDGIGGGQRGGEAQE